MKTRKRPLLLWSKRLFIYVLGLFLMAMGVVFSSRSSLGVSPVSSLGNVMYQIALDKGAPSFFNLGNCTTIVFCFYLVVEALLLLRDFDPTIPLQVVASLLFGQLVNLAGTVLKGLPTPGNYVMQLVYLFVSIPLVAAGVMLYLSPSVMPMPGEGLTLAVSRRTGLSVGTTKTIFDSTVVVLSVVVSLLYFRSLVGVREGTVICALLVGFVLKLLQKPFQKPLLRFVERESRVERALDETSAGFLTDMEGNPKIIITIGREYGSGGHEIAERLAERLEIPFYDRQIDRIAAQQCGIPLSKMEAISRRMEHPGLHGLLDANYAMTGDALSPDEQLFVAQSQVIRQIAAGGESCVILGRCSDYLLYDDPNCFRIFIHARPDIRVRRTMAVFGVSEEEARRRMESADRARAQYYAHFTGREYGQQKWYHLGLDSGLLGTEESVESIINILRRWCDVRGTHPLYMLRTPGAPEAPGAPDEKADGN